MDQFLTHVAYKLNYGHTDRQTKPSTYSDARLAADDHDTTKRQTRRSRVD